MSIEKIGNTIVSTLFLPSFRSISRFNTFVTTRGVIIFTPLNSNFALYTCGQFLSKYRSMFSFCPVKFEKYDKQVNI